MTVFSPQAPKTITVNLPPLHRGRNGVGGQQEISDHPARFKIAITGRRYGKTILGVNECTKGALSNGGIYWWVAPNYPEINASRAWFTLKILASQVPGTRILEADRYIIFPNGGEIWVKSADKPESLRGAGLSGLVLDEVAQIPEYVWTDILRPALVDKKGWALMIGTPRGMNWVYRLFERAKTEPGWACFKRPTIDNPYIDPEEIEIAKREAPSEEKFKQEYEADFGASSYLVFPEFNRSIHIWKGQVPEFTAFRGGLDFGGDSVGNHKSAGSVAGIFGPPEDDTMIIFREFEQFGPNIGERHLNWITESDWLVNKLSKAVGKSNRRIIWVGDKTQMWGISLVHSMGYPIFKSKGGADSIIEGCELIHRRLRVRKDGNPRLYVLPECTRTIAAIERYHNPEPDESKVRPQNPVPIDDDLMDATRYMVEGRDRRKVGDPAELYKNQLGRITDGRQR